MYIHRLNET